MESYGISPFRQNYAQGKYQEVISTDFNAEPYPLEIAEYITLIKLESYDAICKIELDNVSLEGFRTFKAYYSSCKRSKASKHLVKAGALLFSASFALSSISGCPYDVLMDGLKGYKDIPADQKEEYCQQYSYLYSKAVGAFNDLSNKAFLEFDYNKVKSFLNESEFFSAEDISNDFFKDGKSTPEKLFEYACQYGKAVPIETMRILFDDTKTLSRGTMSEKYLGFWLRRYDEYGFDFIKQVIDNQEDRFVSTDLISKTLPNEGSFVKKTGSLMNNLVLDYQAYLESSHNNIPLMKFCQASVLWSDLVKKVSVQYDQQEMSKMSKAVELLDGLSYSMIVKYQKYCNCFDPTLIASLNIVLDESSNRLFGKPYKKDLQKAENSSVDVDSITVKLVSVQLKKKKKKAAIIWISIIVVLATIATLLFFLFNKPSHVHSYSESWESDSLCHWHKCSCGATSNVEKHSFGDWTVVKESTNTTEGEKGHSCSICGYYETATITILQPGHVTHSFGTSWSKNENSHWHECSCGEKTDEAKHTFSAWTTIKEATTDIEGEKTRLCTVCGFSEKTTIPRLNHIHSYGTVWMSNENKHWHECECGEKTGETNHTFDTWTTVKEPTNSAEGQKKHSCSVCGYTETEFIPKLDHTHSYSTTWMSNDSSHWHQCSCGEKSNTENHAFGNWTVTKTATCSSAGSQKRVCGVCGYSQTNSINKLAHTPVVDSGIEPTCTTAGKTDGSHCSVCGTIITEQQNVKALGHNYVSVVTPPTATVDGFTTHTCSRCGNKYVDSIVKATGSIGLAYERVTGNWGAPECRITGIGSCTDTEIYVPKEIDGLTVVEIGANAFENQKHITSINLPDTIKTIGYRAFYGCTNLKKANLPKSVKTLFGELFDQSGIETIVSSMENLDYNFGDSAILSSIPLKSIVFEGTIIPLGICKDCTNLTSVTIKSSVTKIDFAAFYGCSSLKKIVIPDSIEEIGDSAFAECTSLSDVTLSNRLVQIGSSCFEGCTSLASISIPNSVRWISRDAFRHCTALSSIVIPNNVTEIDMYVFGYCTSLKTVTLPDSINSLYQSAFEGCPTQMTIIYKDTIEKWNSINFGGYGYWVRNFNVECTNGTIPNMWE